MADRRAVLWVIAGLLGVIAVCLVGLLIGQGGGGAVSVALGQPVTRGGSRGVFAFTGQFTKNSFAVYMVDVDAGTIWAYEIVSRTKELRLAAARDWRYDRYLEAFNCAAPTPREVESLVEDQRVRQLQALPPITP